MNHNITDGSSWAYQARQDLFMLAGRDSHALLLLGELFDAALDETEVDLEALRPHCATPSDEAQAKQIDFLLTTLPSYIHDWAFEDDDPTVRSWEKEILAGLFSLRSGELPCRSCLDIGWCVEMLHPRVKGHIDCVACREATLRAFNRPALRVVA